MTAIDWAAVFDHADRNPPLDPGLRDAVSASVCTPPDAGERDAIVAEGGPDPDLWKFPARPLPPSYLDFLCWSNGGFFLTGDRELQMLAAEELREYLLTYRLPYHRPGAVPFALDGGGGFYLFDLAEEPDGRGEYPIVFAPGGDLRFDDPEIVGRSFVEVCRGRTKPGADPS
jgi:hypothetical protein